MAKALDIPVYTILVGKGGKVPFPQGRTCSATPSGARLEIPINPELLQEIADATGGEYYRATDRESLAQGLQQVLDSLERASCWRAGRRANYREDFHPFLLLAFAARRAGAAPARHLPEGVPVMRRTPGASPSSATRWGSAQPGLPRCWCAAVRAGGRPGPRVGAAPALAGARRCSASGSWTKPRPRASRAGAPVVQGGFYGLGLLLFGLALAQPQCGSRSELTKRRGIDVVVALDARKSMLARDVQPSRLERAKLELTTLLDELKGDRVGLVAFAGDAFVQCPLTSDYSAAKLFLRAVDPDQMPQGGTNIGDALLLVREGAGERGPRRQGAGGGAALRRRGPGGRGGRGA